MSRLRRDLLAPCHHLRRLGFHLVFPVLLNNPSPKEAQRSRGSPIRPNSRPAWVLQSVEGCDLKDGIQGVRGAPARPLVLSTPRNPPNRCSDWLHCTIGKDRSEGNCCATGVQIPDQEGAKASGISLKPALTPQSIGANKGSWAS